MTQHAVGLEVADTVAARQRRPFEWLPVAATRGRAPANRRVQRLSLVAGLAGIVAIALAAVLLFVLVGWQLSRWITDAPPAWVTILIVGSVCAPLAAGFSLAAFVSFFVTAPVTYRFLFAIATLVPTFLLMVSAMELSGEFASDTNYYFELGSVLLAFVLGVGAVAVVVQLGSRWSLAPYHAASLKPSPLSIRALIELTAISAVMLAIWKLAAFDSSMFLVLSVAAALGIGCGILLLPLVLGGLAARGAHRGFIAGFAIAATLASGWCALMHAFEYGDVFTPRAIGLILASGTLISAAYTATCWLVVWWLRGCGWSTTRR